MSKSARIQKIKDFFNDIQSSLPNEEIWHSTMISIPYWIGAALVGLVAVGYAKAFGYIEHLATSIYTEHPWYIFIGAPIFFLSAWAIVAFFAPAAGGSGIPQLMVATELAHTKNANYIDRLLGLGTIAVKILSSFLCVLGGGAIGREGPTLQIAGSVFHLLRKSLPSWWPPLNSQSMIIAGGAAGLAAAFNTPLGGIVYVVEELAKVHLSYFRTSVLQAVIVSGLVAQLILGPYLYLGYPKVSPVAFADLPSVILIGLIIGLFGGLSSRLLLKLLRWRAQFPDLKTQILFALGAGLAFAILIFTLGPAGLGPGRETIVKLLFSQQPAGDWTWAVSRFFANIFSFVSGCAGGIFAPALATGAAMGSAISSLFANIDVQVVIVLGMVAFLTGITHTPFTSFVLVLEMTDRHSVIFPMMLAAMSAYSASKLIDKKSFYEHIKETYMENLHQAVPERKSKMKPEVSSETTSSTPAQTENSSESV